MVGVREHQGSMAQAPGQSKRPVVCPWGSKAPRAGTEGRPGHTGPWRTL